MIKMEKNKRGQVTLFIIIAIVIVVIGVLIFAFYPKLKATTGFSVENPERYLQNCLENDLQQITKTISEQGGELEPTNYYLYEDQKLNYLCYTNQNYKLCTVQKPFLQNSIEKDITENISLKANECWNSLIEKYESKSYSVSAKKGTLKTEIFPSTTVLRFLDYEISVTKNSIETHKSFNVILNNNLYELLETATNIVEWESSIGDADMWVYMMFFPDLKAEKIKQTDESTVYILTNKKTKEKFQFASRSLAFPPGI